jgi:hypothetical protein
MKNTGGTWLYEATSDLLLTQEALGHRSPETTRRYVPLNRLRMQQAMQNFFTSDSDKSPVLSRSDEKDDRKREGQVTFGLALFFY